MQQSWSQIGLQKMWTWKTFVPHNEQAHGCKMHLPPANPKDEKEPRSNHSGDYLPIVA